MNDVTVFLQMALALVATVTPFVILVRLVAGRDDHGFDAIRRPNAALS